MPDFIRIKWAKNVVTCACPATSEKDVINAAVHFLSSVQGIIFKLPIFSTSS